MFIFKTYCDLEMFIDKLLSIPDVWQSFTMEQYYVSGMLAFSFFFFKKKTN